GGATMAAVVARVVALLAATACVAGCSSASSARSASTTPTTFPKRFCSAATRYENELNREASSDKRNLARQLTIVVDLASTAPPQIRADAQTFLHALQAVGHDPKVRDNPAIEQAVNTVNRYASNKCGFFTQQGPSTGF
ncbi:MAG TPA: hypothetical protein VGU73_02830, partial [Acidimicrobiia bacterium]|nr:hypothetical protein [Acidimicrobiia bacterium]